MTWFVWRQQRLQVLVSTVVVSLFAVLVALTGIHMAHLYDSAVRQCPSCVRVGELFQGYGAVFDLMNITVALPLLLGVVLGATLVARETEQATHVLGWTQTVTRRRWLLTKVVAAVGGTVVVAGVVAALVTWWSGTTNSLFHDRFDPQKFDTQNLMPVAYALFAVGLGLAAGAFLRRALPAIAVTVGAFVVARLLVETYLRPHYQAPRTLISSVAARTPAPTGSWVISDQLTGPGGRSMVKIDLKAVCPHVLDRQTAAACIDRLGYHITTTFQPATRYWRFQWIESGIFVAAAAVLLVAGVVHTLRHDA